MSDPLPRYALWSGLDHLSADDALDFVGRVEAAGYGAFWTREGFGREPFALLAAAAAHTQTLILGTGIANIYARDPVATCAAAATLQELTAGRFILGLGVSHRPWVESLRGHAYGPARQTVAAYLEGLAAADYRAPTPFGRAPVVLAALRPRLLELARDATAGAFPYLTPVAGVSRAREILDANGQRPWLIVSLAAALSNDPGEARDRARRYVASYLGLPAYPAALREHGFDETDFGPAPSDRLVDAVVAQGRRPAILDRARALFDAGADQVAIVPLRGDGTVGSLEVAEELAPPW